MVLKVYKSICFYIIVFICVWGLFSSSAQAEAVSIGLGTWEDCSPQYEYGQVRGICEITYFNGKYIAVGNGGIVRTTTDYKIWTYNTSCTTDYLMAVECNSDLMVSVGESGTIITFNNTNEWANRISNTTNTLKDVIYGNGVFVAVGMNGTILTSSDGITWMSRSSNTSKNLSYVAYGNGSFVVVGDDGTIIVSNDGGESWSSCITGATQHLNGIAYGNKKFIAVGDNGVVLISENLLNWSVASCGTQFDLNSIAYGNGTFNIVGDNIPIMASKDGILWGNYSSEGYSGLSKVFFINNNFFALGSFETVLKYISTTPKVNTLEVYNISTGSAIINGIVTNDGGEDIIEQGICWNTSENPTIENNKIQSVKNDVNISANLSGLIPSTLYHVRAYASNSVGISYGDDRTFFTSSNRNPAETQVSITGNIVEWILDSNNEYIYAITSNNKLLFIHTSDLQIISQLSLSISPTCIDLDNGKLYISSSSINKVVVVNIGTRSIEKNINLTVNPYKIAVDGNKMFYVENTIHNYISYLYLYDLLSGVDGKLVSDSSLYAYTDPDIAMDKTNHILYIAETGKSSTDVYAISTIDYTKLTNSHDNDEFFVNSSFPTRHIIYDNSSIYVAEHRLKAKDLAVTLNFFDADILYAKGNYVFVDNPNASIYSPSTSIYNLDMSKPNFDLPFSTELILVDSNCNVYYYYQNIIHKHNVVEPIVRSIAISGATNIIIPSDGSMSSQYSANLYNQFDQLMNGNTSVVWSLGSPVTGVAINVDTGELTIDNNAQAGAIIVRAAAGKIIASYNVTLQKRILQSINISGNVNIKIPESGSITCPYSIIAKDQFGQVITGQTVTWSLTNPVSGVAIDKNTGVLTVDSTVKQSSIEIKAENGSIFGIYQVVLDKSVIFADTGLETAIRTNIGILSGVLYGSDVLKIKTLRAEAKNITHLGGIEYLKNLEALYISNNNISDITLLRYLDKLKVIESQKNKISDLEPLRNLTGITKLDLTGNLISNINGLENLTALNELWIGNNLLNDISILANLKALTFLTIGDDFIEDISVLANNTSLKTLSIYSKNISNISSLSYLTSLRELAIVNTNVSDITVLSNLVNLRILYLHYNKIVDISAISNLVNLRELNLEHNAIKNINALKNFTAFNTLFLLGNPIEDYTPVSDYYDTIQNKDFNLGTINLESNLHNPQFVGNTIKLIASSTGILDPKYKFMVYQNYAWTLLQDYHTEVNYNWLPKKSGEYILRVYVKNMSSTRSYFAYKDMVFSIAEASKPTYMSILGMKELEIPKDGKNLISLYSAEVKDQYDKPIEGQAITWSLENIGDGISMNSVTGELTVTSSAHPSTISIKAVLGTLSSTYSIKLIQTSVTVTSLIPVMASPQLISTPITLTCHASGGTLLNYEFWVNNGSGWALAQAYSTSNIYDWTPGQAGNYQICVWVKDVSSTKEYDAYTTISYTIIAATVTEVKDATLVTDLASPQNSGKTIRLTASASGGTQRQYQFWVNNGSGWALTQAYSTSNIFDWTPEQAGSYQICVWVKDALSTKEYDTYTIISYEITTAEVKDAILATDLASPQNNGKTIRLTASANGGTQRQYQFWVNNGSGWVLTQSYSTNNIFDWVPGQAGSYQICVWVKDVPSTKEYDAYTTISYTITAAVVTEVKDATLVTDLASPQNNGKTIRLTASANGGTQRQYQFWVNNGSGWVLTQAYSTSNIFDWVPGQAGSYQICVWVKDVSSTKEYDAYTTISYTITAAVVTEVKDATLVTDLASPQNNGNTIRLTASASGGTQRQYQFWVNNGSGWALMQAYSTSNIFDWTSGQAGCYQICVWVKDVSSTKEYDAYTTISYTITAAVVTEVKDATLVTDLASPQNSGNTIRLTASANGGTQRQYQFWVNNGSGWALTQAYSTGNIYDWTPGQAGNYQICVWVKDALSTKEYDAYAIINYFVNTGGNI